MERVDLQVFCAVRTPCTSDSTPLRVFYWSQLEENDLSKLPRRSKRSRRVRKINGIDPGEQLTPTQACEYAAQRNVDLNTNVLALLRRDGKGPPYYKKGNRVLYTPRFLDPYIRSRQPRLINPAERRK